MIFLAILFLVLLALALSAYWTARARDRRSHLTDVGRTSAHQLAMTFALWAIAAILLGIYLR